MKKFLVVLLTFALLVGAFSGCALVEDDDSNAIIAKVNGKSILKSEYDEVFDYYVNMFISYYGYDQATAVDYVNTYMADSILKQLISDEVLKQKAEAEGYLNYNEEHREAAQKFVDEDKQSYIDALVKEYEYALGDQEIKGKNEGESNSDYFKRIAAEKYVEYLEENGSSVEKMMEEKLLLDALERFENDKLKDVTVTEGNVSDKYSSLLTEQEQAFTTDKIYVNARNGESVTLDSGATATYSTIVFNRKGYSLVQHILINFEEEDLTKLKTILGQVEDADEEIASYKKLVDDETDATKKADYQKKLDDAQKLRDSYQEQYDIALKAACAKIQSKTDEVYNSVKDGDEANFIKVMIEKTEDPGMKTEENAKKGYLVGPEDGMVTEFSEAGRALEAGQISEPVATYYGYHIIRCIEKLPEGKIDYESVKDELREELTETKKQEEWSKMLEMWISEADVKEYKDRL